ncbi:MAG: hypothetical protein JNL75_09335, partial [Chitinophagales bacterium]|nr:hypothetical protein [Chitinophagales bacterium]
NDLENADEHLFSLYRLYLDKEDAASAEKVKAELIAKYPNSKYALYALNPNAKSQEEKSDLAVAKLYKEAYTKYQKTFYSEALDMCNSIVETYPDHKLTPKVKLLKAFIYSYIYNAEDYVKALQDIISQHKNTEEAKVAKEYLDLHLNLKSTKAAVDREFVDVKKEVSVAESLETKPSETSLLGTIEKSKESITLESKPLAEESKKEETPLQKETSPVQKDATPRKEGTTIASDNQKKTEDGLQIVNYAYKPTARHAIIFKLSSDLKETTAKNMLDVYHRTNFKGLGYKTEVFEIDNHRFLSIGGYKTVQDAIEFYAKMESDVLIKKLVIGSEKYYISSENLDILYISSGWDQYVSFYEKNYR